MMRRLLVVLVVVALAPMPAFGATPPPFTAPPTPDGSMFDPRSIPSVADAEAALAIAQDERDDAYARLATAEEERARVQDEIARLGGADRDLATTIQSTRGHLRSLAVATYIAGGPISALDFLLDTSDAGELTWRRFMLQSSFENTVDAARAYDASKANVGADIVAVATRADRLDDEIEALQVEIPQRDAAVAAAAFALGSAQHEADHRAGRIVVRSGDDGGPLPEESQNAAGPAWEKLRFCESGGNYAIADSSGLFRGAYQFAVSTWYGMGGVGDPADGPPSEQDYRAQILYDALGAKPWPVCGRFLIEDPPGRSDALPGLADGLPPGDLAGPGVTTPSTSTTTSTSTTSTSTTTTTAPEPESP